MAQEHVNCPISNSPAKIAGRISWPNTGVVGVPTATTARQSVVPRGEDRASRVLTKGFEDCRLPYPSVVLMYELCGKKRPFATRQLFLALLPGNISVVPIVVSAIIMLLMATACKPNDTPINGFRIRYAS